MADQPRCDDCGVFQQRTTEAGGSKGWLCLNCSTDPAIEAVADVRDALGLNKRIDAEARTCAFAFGLADSLANQEITHGRSPVTVAAACVYLGSILADNKLMQSEIADAAGTSTSAFRGSGSSAHYRDLYEASGYADHFGDIEKGQRDHTNPVIDLDGWRDHLETRQNADTVKANVSNVRRFAVWYDGNDQPTADDAEAWLGYLADEGYAPSTIEGRYESLRDYFKWADLGALDLDVDEYIGRAYQQRV